MLMPKNNKPNPKIASAMILFFSSLANIFKNTPTAMNSGANSLKFNAINCAVIVVPIFVPTITPAACITVIIEALTRPTTITVVAEEL